MRKGEEKVGEKYPRMEESEDGKKENEKKISNFGVIIAARLCMCHCRGSINVISIEICLPIDRGKALTPI